jgi:hypothetical protein
MTLEYRKCCGSPRTSQIPWSFSSQRVAAASAQAIRNLFVSSQHLAVDVDLLLVPRAVTHADRSAVAPSLQVGERAFGEVVLAADSEHDLQSFGGTDAGGGRCCHEGEKVVRLVRTRSDPERLHRETGVADPGVAVVPVPLAANALRKRRRCRRHDRTAGLERQSM